MAYVYDVTQMTVASSRHFLGHKYESKVLMAGVSADEALQALKDDHKAMTGKAFDGHYPKSFAGGFIYICPTELPTDVCTMTVSWIISARWLHEEPPQPAEPYVDFVFISDERFIMAFQRVFPDSPWSPAAMHNRRVRVPHTKFFQVVLEWDAMFSGPISGLNPIVEGLVPTFDFITLEKKS